MKTFTFVAVTLFAGAVAGTVLGIINQGIVEPFIEQAIALENQNAEKSGEFLNPTEFTAYRLWQKGGEIAAGTVLGMSMGALFGIVFAYARRSLPGSSEKRKALILAGIMFLVLFLVPAFKYPANPPAVGDPDTIYYRQSLYIAFVAISGFSALGLAFLYTKMGATQVRKAIVPAAYASIIAITFLAMPPNPDAITAPMDLVMSFRIASAFTMSIFWGVLGILLGSFWDLLRPHETTRIKAL
jgi:predicted cobalt transporter CbtA